MDNNCSNNGILTHHMVLSKTRANSLSDIKAINLWGFDLSDVSLFKSMQNVEIVSMPMNKITSLKQFAFCPNLRELLLRHNQITDIKEIENLVNCPNLHRLWLTDNPICEIQGYRNQIVSLLPQLDILDEIPITDNDRFQSFNKQSGVRQQNYQCLNQNQMPAQKVMPENVYSANEMNEKEKENIKNLIINDNEQQQQQHRRRRHRNKRKTDDDAGALTAVLALLPSLNPDSLAIVLNTINELSQRC